MEAWQDDQTIHQQSPMQIQPMQMQMEQQMAPMMAPSPMWSTTPTPRYAIQYPEEQQPYQEEPLFSLRIRQQPKHARIHMSNKEKDRKPIDPPPIVQLVRRGGFTNGAQHYLANPFSFCKVFLEEAPGSTLGATGQQDAAEISKALCGSTVCSLHRLRETREGGGQQEPQSESKDGGFFVFPELYVRKEGWYVLRFQYMDRRFSNDEYGDWYTVCSVCSDAFQVANARNFPGMQESTNLTRWVSEQGVRIRLRKDSRALRTRKRNQAMASQLPRDSDVPTVSPVHAPSQLINGERPKRMRHDGSMIAPVSVPTTYALPSQMTPTSAGYPPASMMSTPTSFYTNHSPHASLPSTSSPVQFHQAPFSSATHNTLYQFSPSVIPTNGEVYPFNAPSSHASTNSYSSITQDGFSYNQGQIQQQQRLPGVESFYPACPPRSNSNLSPPASDASSADNWINQPVATSTADFSVIRSQVWNMSQVESGLPSPGLVNGQPSETFPAFQVDASGSGFGQGPDSGTA